MEGSSLLSQAQFFGIPGRPGIDLILRLPQDNAPAVRRQVRGRCFDYRLHVGLGAFLERWIQAVHPGSVIGHAIITPLTVNVGTRAQDNPEALLCQQVEKTEQVSARVRFAAEIVAARLDLMEVPADVGRDHLQPHLACPPQDRPPAGGVKPPVMDFSAEQGNSLVAHPHFLVCDSY